MNRIKPEDFDKHTRDTEPMPKSPESVPTNVVWSPTVSQQPTTPPIQNVTDNPSQTTSPPVINKPATIKPVVNKPVSPVWKITTALFATIAIIFGFGWQNSYKQADLYLSQLNNEKRKLNAISAQIPLLITDIKFRNIDKDGNALGDYSKSFNQSEVRYISWYASIQNTGEFTLQGDLYVKYIRPNGQLDYNSDSSPEGYTMKQSILIANEETVSRGWGNADVSAYSPGDYRVQFWWKEKLVAEQTFTVR